MRNSNLIYPKSWYLLTLMGVLLIIAGLIAIASPVYATMFTIFLLGWLLAIGGVIQILYAFSSWKTGGFLLHLLLGIFCTLFGILILNDPVNSAISLTFLIAIFFLTIGLFRILISIFTRFESWMWFLLLGIVDVILGFLILKHWPTTGLWVIGLFVGIDFFITGLAFVFTSFRLKDLRQEVLGSTR